MKNKEAAKSKNSRLITYKIEKNTEENSLKIFANKEARKRIIELLNGQPFHLKERGTYFSSYLSLDYRALKFLQENQHKINLEINDNSWRPEPEEVNQSIGEEETLTKTLEAHLYNLDQRIWTQEIEGVKNYFTLVNDEIYSCDNLDNMLGVVNGEYLIEYDKPIIRLSKNPFDYFGILEVGEDLLSKNRNTLHYNRSQDSKKRSRKKEYRTLIKGADPSPITLDVDGVDDTMGSNPVLPLQSASLLQGLLIFPSFLRLVYSGYKSAEEGVNELNTKYLESGIKIAKVEAELMEFRKELCRAAEIDYAEAENYTPQNLISKINRKLLLIRRNHSLSDQQKEEQINNIINLCNDYGQKLKEDTSAPEFLDINMAYLSWMAGGLMLASVSAMEARALINMFGGINKWTMNSQMPILSQAATFAGMGVEGLTVLYAGYKIYDELKGAKQVKKELERFKGITDVSELAREITTDILNAQKNNHQVKAFGNAVLAIGQSMMLFGGSFGFGINPVYYAGLGITALGTATKAVSEAHYQMSYGINSDFDAVETSLLATPPKFKKENSSDINSALNTHFRLQRSALEILGHLRAPQYVLHEKFLERNQDDDGFLDKAFSLLPFSDKAMKAMRHTNRSSINMAKNNIDIDDITTNYPHDLDLFWVEEKDTDFIWKLSEQLTALSNLNQSIEDDVTKKIKINEIIEKINEIRKEEYEKIPLSTQTCSPISYPDNVNIEAIKKTIIAEIQKDFIKNKLEIARIKNISEPDSIKKICQRIIDRGGRSAIYLRRKLLRAIANGDMTYKKDEEEKKGQVMTIKNISQNKNIKIVKFDLNKFDEGQLADFLTRKRLRKDTGHEKKSVLTKAREEEQKKVQSQHFRPFNKISKINSIRDIPPIYESEDDSENEDDDDKNQEDKKGSRNIILSSPTSDSKKLNETDFSRSNPSSIRHELLKFDAIAKQPIEKSPQKRKTQIADQNNMITSLTKNTNRFKLGKVKRVPGKNQTSFTFVSPTYPKSKEHQIIYIRDNISGKIDTIYGSKTNVIITQKAQKESNGSVVIISQKIVEKFGDQTNSNLEKFTLQSKISPATTTQPKSGSVISLIDTKTRSGSAMEKT